MNGGKKAKGQRDWLVPILIAEHPKSMQPRFRLRRLSSDFSWSIAKPVDDDDGHSISLGRHQSESDQDELECNDDTTFALNSVLAYQAHTPSVVGEPQPQGAPLVS